MFIRERAAKGSSLLPARSRGTVLFTGCDCAAASRRHTLPKIQLALNLLARLIPDLRAQSAGVALRRGSEVAEQAGQRRPAQAQ